MARTTRRDFFKSAALGIAAITWDQRGAMTSPLSLGLASYTFREFSLEDTISMAKRVGLEKIALKSVHLPLESSQADITAAGERIKNAGLDLYGCGVVYMTNKAEVEQAFNYARMAKIRIIVGAPDPDLLEFVSRKVKEYDIKLAVHNHGPEDKLYPTPESAYERVESLDQRLGLCLDVGHAKRSGVDPAEAAGDLPAGCSMFISRMSRRLRRMGRLWRWAAASSTSPNSSAPSSEQITKGPWPLSTKKTPRTRYPAWRNLWDISAESWRPFSRPKSRWPSSSPILL